MSVFHSMNTTTSALTVQRLRMDVVSSNMANLDTTRARQVDGEWEPYRRKTVSLQPKDASFSSMLGKAMGKTALGRAGEGVRVGSIREDQETPFKPVYDPSHPDANGEGYVMMPNVDPLREMVTLMSATRSYEANVTALNAQKSMLMKTLEIGK